MQNPMRLQDLAIVTNTPLDTDLVLLEKFRAHDRIQHDPKTDLYSYKVGFTRFLKESLVSLHYHSTNMHSVTKLHFSQKYNGKRGKEEVYLYER